MNHFFTGIRKFVLAGVLTGLIGAAVVVFPVGNVFAAFDPQTTNPPVTPTAPAAPARNTAANQASRLEKRLKNQQAWLAVQGRNLDRANTLITRAQAIIDRFKSRGVDVQALQTALDNFKATLPSAVQVHNTASGILKAHAGFNDSGVVTDIKTARATVQSAHESLLQAHQILHSAVTDLRKEIVNFRGQHKPAPKPTPTAAAPAS
jgi:hypothetical protein